MTERVAIVGSRDGADLEKLTNFLLKLWRKYPYTTLVSGGARGVDQKAEQTWLQLGGRVESYRPVKKDNHYLIEKWELGGPDPAVYLLPGEPTWDNFKSAALYRDILIAERADRVVTFVRYGGSRGAGFTAEMAKECYEKPTYVYEARRHDGEAAR
jgi:hypothetical protein